MEARRRRAVPASTCNTCRHMPQPLPPLKGTMMNSASIQQHLNPVAPWLGLVWFSHCYIWVCCRDVCSVRSTVALKTWATKWASTYFMLIKYLIPIQPTFSELAALKTWAVTAFIAEPFTTIANRSWPVEKSGAKQISLLSSRVASISYRKRNSIISASCT